jgi:hypothetical protein
MSKGMELLRQANEVREQGDPLRSLQIADGAAIEFQKEGNLTKLAETCAIRLLAYRHLFDSTGDTCFLILGKYAALAGVAIAESSGDKTALAIPYFNLAKIIAQTDGYKEAVKYYEKALDYMIKDPPPSHDRKGVVADFKIHLSICQYRSGDKTALNRLEEAVSELDASGEKEFALYNYLVWKSGAYMEAAKMLAEENPTLAKEYLAKARGIVESDERLSIRRGQWWKIADSLGVGR